MIGLALTTYKRFDYIYKSLTSLKENNYGGADIVIVIEDDKGYDYDQQNLIKNLLPDSSLYIRQKNSGVAVAKNKALEILLSKKCEHIFLMEDDIILKDSTVCHKYIDYAKNNNVEHMNFALHGGLNIEKNFYYDGKTVYPHCVGAFSYYTSKCIKEVGFFDENFKNALEHVEHTWRISKKEMTTPFFNFIDHPESYNMLEEIPGSSRNSSINTREDSEINKIKAKDYWIKKHGSFL
jgi:GT2 family glycosyltransferase